MNAAQPGPPANRSRRRFFQAAGVLSAAALTPKIPGAADSEDNTSLPPAFSALKPLGDRVHPITLEEFRARIEHAQLRAIATTQS